MENLNRHEVCLSTNETLKLKDNFKAYLKNFNINLDRNVSN